MSRLESVSAVRLLLAWLLAIAPGLGAQAASESMESSGEESGIVDFWQAGDPGQRLHILGRVTSSDGRPISGASLTIWQADGAGSYHDDRYRGVIHSADDGGYRFSTVLPGQYYSVKHIHMVVEHRAHRDQPTRILFKGDPLLDQVADGHLAIDVEEARVEGETVLFGRFDIVMQPVQ